tara:strand:- start:10729 stop:11970 length:1242 start_codon:yes stop_codon:yes gene_type:complete
MIKFITLLFALSSPAMAQDLDQFLRAELTRFQMTSPETIERPATEILVLGHELFRDRQLSGNDNISCHDCHHPMLGTGDAVSLAIGEGGSFQGRNRTQDQGKVVARHSPNLINLGHKQNFEMFWDARVRIDRRTNELITPEAKLKDHPEITKHLTSALAAQTIFPILSPEEMRGQPGSNAIANLDDSIEIWDAVIAKLKKTKAPNNKSYVELFNKAFPEETHNAGHMGKAMASFISWRFQVNNTPFDRYLAGDNLALSDDEKQGLKVFMGKARCAVCHHGQLLTNHMVMNVAVPPLHIPGGSVDRGFRNRFAFKTPGLRDVAKTAPYMHNGVFQTLEEVIEHYDNVPQSLKTFEPSEQTHFPYQSRLVRVFDAEVLQDIEDDLIQPFLRRGLGLTSQEKSQLLKFLKISLTSP